MMIKKNGDDDLARSLPGRLRFEGQSGCKGRRGRRRVGGREGEAGHVGAGVGVGATIKPNPPHPIKKKTSADTPMRILVSVRKQSPLSERGMAYVTGDCLVRAP